MIGDLHLTDNARDSYRFEIFDWIAKQQAKRDPIATFLAGDLTDAKDRHSATLVNQVVEGLTSLKPPIYICRGNHDYRDPNNPFFKFLNNIDGLLLAINPIVVGTSLKMAIIPHFRDQDKFDSAVRGVSAANPAAFLVHQTFDGAIAESGVRLTGLSASLIESLKPPLGVYAGDVHRPQTSGIVTYIGCPYQVRFGDNFEPRSLWVAEDRDINLRFPAPRKWSLTISGPKGLKQDENLLEGDQVKLTVKLGREEAMNWKKIKKSVLEVCKQRNLQVYGLSLELEQTQTPKRIMVKGSNHASIFDQFNNSESLAPSVRAAGKKIMEGNHGN